MAIEELPYEKVNRSPRFTLTPPDTQSTIQLVTPTNVQTKTIEEQPVKRKLELDESVKKRRRVIIQIPKLSEEKESMEEINLEKVDLKLLSPKE